MMSPDRYAAALRFAAERHHGQMVPGTSLPYVIHLSMVAAEVIEALSRERFDDPDLAVTCALLHDTIEDTGASEAEIAAYFGDQVAKGVRALSKDPSLDKEQSMLDSLKRIQEQPREVWLVKLGDRITNLQPPPSYWSKEKCAGYRAEAQKIHAALAEASPYLGARLLEKIESYAQYT